MCPPVSEINEYWTDEQIFMSLSNFKSGNPLPSNVTSDVNPYQYKPSDLPADLWYFCSVLKKDAEFGFWVPTGEASKICSSSTIFGFRTTLHFHEGHPPNARKTDWVMQEYTIQDKHNTNVKDHRALCRVFLADGNKPSPCHHIANINIKVSVKLGPTSVANNVFTSELLENSMDYKTGPSLVTRRSPNRENSAEMECILKRDYLELDDLTDPGSISSSSANSSCLTMTSEEHFDSMALLCELDGVVPDHKTKDSSVKFNLSAPVKPKEVVLCPDTFVSLENDKDFKPCAQATLKVDVTNGSATNVVNATSSSSSVRPSGFGRNGHNRKTKTTKMKYFCFFAF